MRIFYTALFLFIWLPCHAQPLAEENKMTLEYVLLHTQRNNPTLAAAHAELEAAQELYPQALAGWKPTIDAQASIYHSDIDNSNFGNADGTTTKDASLNIEQPLFRSGRTIAQTERAQSSIQAAEHRYRRIEQDILLGAARAYINILSDRKLYVLRQDNERYLEEERRATQEKLASGFLTVTDVKQAESRLARARAETLQAARRLEDSYAQFTQITGMESVDTFYYPAEDETLLNNIDTIIAAAESSNPELQEKMFIQEAAEHNIDVNFREYFPQIFAFASYNRQYDPQPGIVDKTENKTIGLRATIPLYNAGLTASRTREATSTAAQRMQETRETRRKILAQIRTEWDSYTKSRAEADMRRIEMAAAEEAKAGVQEEAQLGERTILDVLDADQDLLTSKAALIEAKRTALQARYSLLSLIGALPDSL
jgi:outer membrane protein